MQSENSLLALLRCSRFSRRSLRERVSREQSSLGLPLATEGTQEARLSYAKAKPLFEAKPQRARALLFEAKPPLDLWSLGLPRKCTVELPFLTFDSAKLGTKKWRRKQTSVAIKFSEVFSEVSKVFPKFFRDFGTLPPSLSVVGWSSRP